MKRIRAALRLVEWVGLYFMLLPQQRRTLVGRFIRRGGGRVWYK